MVAIERDNQRLKGVLPKDYARPGLDKHRLGELIDLIGTISLVDSSTSPLEGERAGVRGRSHRSKDILGRVYEYFLGQFASAEGKKAASSTRRRASSALFFLHALLRGQSAGSASKWELHCHCRFIIRQTEDSIEHLPQPAQHRERRRGFYYHPEIHAGRKRREGAAPLRAPEHRRDRG